MSFFVGSAASSPLTYWQQMLQTGGASGSRSQSFDPLASLMQADAGDTSSSAQAMGTSAPPSPPFGQGMMAQLIALQQQASAVTVSGTSAADPGDAKFFARLDTNGDGSVGQSEVEAAASKHGVSTRISDAVFANIDATGAGNISQSELAAADNGRGHQGHHAHDTGGTGDADDLMSGPGADGSTTRSVTNADGSTTTTITYADGSKIDMTSPAAAPAGNSGSNGPSNTASLNLIEQFIKLQSQAIGAAASALSVVA